MQPAPADSVLSSPIPAPNRSVRNRLSRLGETQGLRPRVQLPVRRSPDTADRPVPSERMSRTSRPPNPNSPEHPSAARTLGRSRSRDGVQPLLARMPAFAAGEEAVHESVWGLRRMRTRCARPRMNRSWPHRSHPSNLASRLSRALVVSRHRMAERLSRLLVWEVFQGSAGFAVHSCAGGSGSDRPSDQGHRLISTSRTQLSWIPATRQSIAPVS
jgi:hypothetical protein